MSWLWTRRPVSDRGTAEPGPAWLPGGFPAGSSAPAAADLLDRDAVSNRDDEDFMGQDKGSDGMRVDTDLIRQLADLLTEKDLSEIEVEDSDRRVVVKRNTAARDMAEMMSRAQAAPAAAAQAASTPAPAPAAPISGDSAASHPGTVKSPMVGTVFLSAEPGTAPFIATGAKVAAGDTLLIVEAMKVMNPITAPKGGIVKQILVQDAQPVEYDQPLVIVE